MRVDGERRILTKEIAMRSHRLVLALLVLNVALALGLLAHGRRASASDAPETLRARAIELVDEHGKVRAQLNVEADGETVLRLRDASGEIRVKIGAGADGSGLLLLDGSAEPGIHLMAKTSGTSVALTGNGGQKRVITP
jgi:hypothetical protein